MAYFKQKVIVENVQADGTYYSAKLQQDSIYALSVQRDQRLGERGLFSPSLTYKLKGSNQNYQHFTMATSSVPAQYVGGFYDYSEVSVALPVSMLMSSRWEFFFTPEWDLKSYANRPPRDENNNFLEGKQANILAILSLGFTYKPNDITRTTFFYTYQNQSSNMKFEKYLPYNYAGHFFGINFNYTY
jgi:hypothetical protein